MFDLKAFLKDKNISQRELSNKIGYSEAYISRVLAHNSPMNEKLEAMIRKAYPEYFDLPSMFSDKEMPYSKEIAIISDDPNGKDIPAFQGHAFATISPAMGDVVTLRPDTFVRILRQLHPLKSYGFPALGMCQHTNICNYLEIKGIIFAMSHPLYL